ncbi:hypothetical protein [uncultured Mediterranean phage uvMED]|nr:hypothetical protein [uncultured Mediterranean phage uvMED]|tara:strand:+ start:1228 stop:2910 length:1683 start_codon:yes stop_codon:yes gene_type:complete
MDLDRLNIFLLVMLIVSTLANAETTNNLLPQQFFNNNSNHNEWTCNDPSHNHGNSIVAAHHGDSIERDVSLSEYLTEDQIQYGWSSTLGADIWHWNNLSSETDMIQTITASDGTVTTQKRTVAFSQITPYQTYTSTYIEGMNVNTNYNINVKFDFRESSQSQYHRAVDLKNPTLVIDYEPNPIFLSTEQETDIATAVEFVEEATDIELIEFEPEEYSFELYETPEIILTTIEEIYIEPLATVEEINTGVIDVFNVPLATEQFSELTELPTIEQFEELPEIEMEIAYDSQENFTEIPTEIQIDETFIETRENFEAQTTLIEDYFSEEVASNETIDTSIDETIIEPEPEEIVERPADNETTIVNDDTTSVVEEISNEDQNSSGQPEAETLIVSEEIDSERNEVDGEREATADRDSDVGNETTAGAEENIESGNQEVEESRNETVSGGSNRVVTIEEIRKKVNETIKRVDQRLVATSIIVAKTMQTNHNLDNYSNVNKNIFNEQLQIDGGEYFETRNYIDTRDIYADISYGDQDVVQRYQEKVQEATDERIRAEEHLRRIRGY